MTNLEFFLHKEEVFFLKNSILFFLFYCILPTFRLPNSCALLIMLILTLITLMITHQDIFHNFHYYNKSILIILTLEAIDYLVIRRSIFYKFLEITIQCLIGTIIIIIIIIMIFIVCIGTNLFKRFQIMIVDWTFKNLKNMFQ